MAYELLEAVSEPDIVLGDRNLYIYSYSSSMSVIVCFFLCLVCCGGGSLLAGISSGLSLLGSKALVYGVEPETANSMHKSFEEGKAVKMVTAKSIAAGLAPPMTSTEQIACMHLIYRFYQTGLTF